MTNRAMFLTCVSAVAFVSCVFTPVRPGEDSHAKGLPANPPATAKTTGQPTATTHVQPASQPGSNGTGDTAITTQPGTQPANNEAAPGTSPPGASISTPPETSPPLASQPPANGEDSSTPAGTVTTVSPGEGETHTKPLPLPLPTTDELIRLLQARIDADMEGGNNEGAAEARKALAGALIARGSAADLPLAEKLLAELAAGSTVNHVNPQWLRLQRAALEQARGETKDAVGFLGEALRVAISELPLEIERLYFTEHVEKAPRLSRIDGMPEPRIFAGEGRENSVYSPGSTMIIAWVYRYLSSVADIKSGAYSYHLQATAELWEEDLHLDGGGIVPGKKVEGFDPVPFDQTATLNIAPDKSHYAVWPLRLPRDIAAERDYELRLTFTDPGRNPAARVKDRKLKVKIRTAK